MLKFSYKVNKVLKERKESNLVDIDIHVHTTISSCSIFYPEALVFQAAKMKLPVVVTTNHHNSIGDSDYLREKLEPLGINYFSGLEMTNQWGDFLIFGEELCEFQGFIDSFPTDLLPRDNVAVVWAHPYRFYSRYEIERIKHLVSPYIDAIEGINGNCMRSCPRANDLAINLGRELDKPLVAGSDAHSENMFFMAHTNFKIPVRSYSDFINALKEGLVDMGDNFH